MTVDNLPVTLHKFAKKLYLLVLSFSFVKERNMVERKPYTAYVTRHAESLMNDIFRHGHHL